MKYIVLASMIIYGSPQPTYPEYGPSYDQRLPLTCSYTQYGNCNVIVTPGENPTDKAMREYRERQYQFQCAQHPDKCGGFKK